MWKLNKAILLTLSVVAVAIGAFCLLRHAHSGPLDGLVNISELPAEFMERYFDGYQEMIQEGKAENILIVMNYERPNEYGATHVVEGPNHTYFMMYDSEKAKTEAFRQLQQDKVVSVEENGRLELAESKQSSGATGADYLSWGVEAMGLDKAIHAVDSMTGRPEVTVAVLDSGVNTEMFREAFPAKSLTEYSVLGGNTGDTEGHGTHVAGIVADGTPSNVGIMAVKVTGDDGSIYTTDAISGINYATGQGVDVINMSFGGAIYSESCHVALEAAKAQGIISVASAGNASNGTNSEIGMGSVKNDNGAEPEANTGLPYANGWNRNNNYPASYDNTISITAVDDQLELADFSTIGVTVDFAAPGVLVNGVGHADGRGVCEMSSGVGSTCLNSGTSMAAPHAAAAMAILKSINKNVKVDDAREVLKSETKDLGGTGWDEGYGYGLISFENARFCGSGTGACDEFGVFEEKTYASMNVVGEPVVTDYNYYSTYNILATEVELCDMHGDCETKKLYELDGLRIENYVPTHTEGPNYVNVYYENMDAEFSVANPTESGWVYEQNGDTVTITGYKNNYLQIPKLIVPSEIDGMAVTAIEGDANSPFVLFANGDQAHGYKGDREYFTQIVLPDSMQTIGRNSFAQMESLTSVEMAGVTTVGRYAFLNDYSLKDVVLPEGLRTIDDYAFARTGLEEVHIPAGVDMIGDYAFEYCGALGVIEVADNNERYNDGSEGFSGIIETETGTLIRAGYAAETSSRNYIPNNVRRIGEGAFSGLTSLGWIDLSNPNLEVIADDAFNGTSRFELTIGALNNSVAHHFARSHSLIYYIYDYSFVDVTPENRQYHEGDVVNASEIAVTLRSDYAKWEETENGMRYVEYTGHDGRCAGPGDTCTHYTYDGIGNGWGTYTIEYQNGDSFQQGDTYYTVRGMDMYDGVFSTTVPVNEVTATEARPTIEIVSVEQNGVSAERQWDEYIYRDYYKDDDDDWFGDWYYPVEYTAEEVKVGVIVDNLPEGQSYNLTDDVTVTSANNGEVVEVEAVPYVSMGDGVQTCTADLEEGYSWCEGDPRSNEYKVSFGLRWNDEYVSDEAILRPAKVGNSNLEIMSVTQDGAPVALDLTGRRVKDTNVEQTLNEYQLTDYSKPVTIEYKLKNLNVGWRYDVNILNSNESFVADTTEKTITKEIVVDALEKHTWVSVNVWAVNANTFSLIGGMSQHYSVNMYFRMAGANYVPLGNLIVDEVWQSGNTLEPVVVEGDWENTYTFDANDVEDIMVDLHVTSATSDANYHIGYGMYGESGRARSVYERDVMTVSGAELMNGATLILPAAYGGQAESPFSLNIYVDMVGGTSYASAQQVYYKVVGEQRYANNRMKFTFYRDENVARYDATLSYANYADVDFDEWSGAINDKYHNADNPLKVTVEGYNYIADQSYTVKMRVKCNESEIWYREVQATGAELNAGKGIIMEGLVLSLPDYEYGGEDYVDGDGYEFEIEINGLRQKEHHYYSSDGSMTAMIKDEDGWINVDNSDGPGGIGSGFYTSIGVAKIHRAMFDRGAILKFIGYDFDDTVEYNYELYVGSDAVAPTLMENKTVTGAALNSGLAYTIVEPAAGVRELKYVLVIKKGNGLVTLVEEYLDLWSDTGITAYKLETEGGTPSQASDIFVMLPKSTATTVKLMGDGFDDEAAYTVKVSYEGGHTVADENGEWRYEMLDFAELAEEFEATGAELNSGEFTYTLAYNEAFAPADELDVGFSVVDGEGRTYPGMWLGVQFMGEHEDVDVEVKVPDSVGQVSVEGDKVIVQASKACMVIGMRNGEYVRLEATLNEQTGAYEFDAEGAEGVTVALVGDLDMGGKVNARDSAKINYYLLSQNNAKHVELTELEKVMADVDGNHKINARDSAAINFSLLSVNNARHIELGW